MRASRARSPRMRSSRRSARRSAASGRRVPRGLRGRRVRSSGRGRRADREPRQRHRSRDLRPAARVRPSDRRRDRRPGRPLPRGTPERAPGRDRACLLAHPGAGPGRAVPARATLVAPDDLQHGWRGSVRPGPERPWRRGRPVASSGRGARTRGPCRVDPGRPRQPDAVRRRAAARRRPPSRRAPEARYRTTIAFGVRNEPGTLLRALAGRSPARRSTSRSSSRARAGRRAWEYVFWTDLDAHQDDPACAARARGARAAVATMVRILRHAIRAQLRGLSAGRATCGSACGRSRSVGVRRCAAATQEEPRGQGVSGRDGRWLQARRAGHHPRLAAARRRGRCRTSGSRSRCRGSTATG